MLVVQPFCSLREYEASSDYRGVQVLPSFHPHQEYEASKDYWVAGGVRLSSHSAVAGDTRGSRPTRDLTFAVCQAQTNQGGVFSVSSNQQRVLSAVGVSPAHPGTRNYITCTGPLPHPVLSKHSNRKHEGISSNLVIMCDLLYWRTRYSIFL